VPKTVRELCTGFESLQLSQKAGQLPLQVTPVAQLQELERLPWTKERRGNLLSSVADPECLSRILIFIHPGSRIQKQPQKSYFIFELVKEKIWANFQCLFRIPDPGSKRQRIPDPDPQHCFCETCIFFAKCA
jgi:hypothetical protein